MSSANRFSSYEIQVISLLTVLVTCAEVNEGMFEKISITSSM